MVIDNVNGLFEMAGGLFVFMSVLKLHRDKKVRGVSMIAIVFFTVWGFWNLFYYPSLDQFWSAVGASSVALMNIVWLCQMVYYTRKERRDGRTQSRQEQVSLSRRQVGNLITLDAKTRGNLPPRRRPKRRRKHT